MTASQRMWLRRIIRLGGFCSKVTSSIVRFIELVGFMWLPILFFGTCISFFGYTIYMNFREQKVATPEEIVSFRTKNYCLKNYIPTLHYPNGSPLKYRDLVSAADKCDTLAENERQVAAQKKAMQ